MERICCIICGEEIEGGFEAISNKRNHYVVVAGTDGKKGYCCQRCSQLIKALSEPGAKEMLELVEEIWNTDLHTLEEVVAELQEQGLDESIIRVFRMAIRLKKEGVA